MSDIVKATSTESSASDAEKNWSLEQVRILSGRLRMMAGIMVPVFVAAGVSMGVTVMNTSNGNDNIIAGALGGIAGAFTGVFFFSVVRFTCTAVLLLCEKARSI